MMHTQENQFLQNQNLSNLEPPAEKNEGMGNSSAPPEFSLSASIAQQKVDTDGSTQEFKGKNPMTRAEFVLWLLKSKANWMKDISLNWKSAEEIMGLGSEWTNGDRPFDPILRAEAAAMLLKFAGLYKTDFEGKVGYFHDVFERGAQPWVFQVAHQARLYGLFRGTAENMFLPESALDPGTAEELIARIQQVGIRSLEEQTIHLAVSPLRQPAIYQNDIYESQRDNVFNDYNPLSEKGTKPDWMCNVTSVAMQLQSLANKEELMREAIGIYKNAGGKKSIEFLGEQQLEDVLIEIVRAKGWSEYNRSDLAKLGRLFEAGGEGTYVFDSVDGGTAQFNASASEIKEGNLQLALDQGKAVIMSSILYGEYGHFVHLLEVLPDGILINDPFGFRMQASSTKYSFLNGGNVYHDKMQSLKSNWDEFLIRSKHNPDLLLEMEEHLRQPDGAFSQKLGKTNFYTWEEVRLWHIGRHGTVAG